MYDTSRRAVTLHLSLDVHPTSKISSECASDALAERIGK